MLSLYYGFTFSNFEVLEENEKKNTTRKMGIYMEEHRRASINK